jgi:putative DNA methylase
MTGTPRRLIEVDLPIKRISEHARREKSIRHGHISTLHIWWARRPLAACRAVLCAALWPDPADSNCPDTFRKTARDLMRKWAKENLNLLGAESLERFLKLQRNPRLLEDKSELRKALLDFIADFANWDNATNEQFIQASHLLTKSACEGLTDAIGSKPLVIDPFAGGGSIPLEALRVGAEVFASDLNPIPILLNKVVLEFIPKYGERLASEVRQWGEWVKTEAKKQLDEFYPTGSDGTIPIAYLWARTIKCEGPGCGAEVPILPSRLLDKGGKLSTWLEFKCEKKKIVIELKTRSGAPKDFTGTSQRGSVTCPCCSYTTPLNHVREQLKANHGGIQSARLLAVVTYNRKSDTRGYRLPEPVDYRALASASKEIAKIKHSCPNEIPDETLPLMSGVFNVPLYGHNTWASLYSDRQLLMLVTLCRLVRQVGKKLQSSDNADFARAICTMLSIAVGKVADYSTTICTWVQGGGFVGHTFAQGQCLPMKYDFAESVPLAGFSGSWEGAIDWGCRILQREAEAIHTLGQAERVTATAQALPDESAACLFTDPPYYNAVPYADLSDFFYVWHRRTLHELYPELFGMNEAPKAEEICEMAGWDSIRYPEKTAGFFETQIGKAFSVSRKTLSSTGIGVIVFAHKTTSGWESLLQAIISSGWIVTASWPIDTERTVRLRAMGSAALGSSIHLVCRPRNSVNGSMQGEQVGDWRDVLHELPVRIHEWMPRLADEGIVGADAIFACLGPALEIYSRYSTVEKANGEKIELTEYLVYVWAAVAKEALAMVFKGADASGFEEDARLTAMWLWTLFAGQEANGAPAAEEDAETEAASKSSKGYALEYDAARKIAQGLGAHLDSLNSLVEIDGDVARLLSVSERTRTLFRANGAESKVPKGKKRSQLDLGFISELKQSEASDEKSIPPQGSTVLDRVHQSMILFAAGRAEALRRFLVDEGVGKDERFWRLAQVLSFLYPKTGDEKRWIDGVLARKKGLGF